ncbi:MAG: hypothetical protein ACJASU_002339 [Cognaticolwellia sp.]|jgi:hypothetical protein
MNIRHRDKNRAMIRKTSDFQIDFEIANTLASLQCLDVVKVNDS